MSYFGKGLNKVPSSLLFHPKTHSNDIILNKQTTQINPYTSRKTFGPNNELKFKITGDKSLDLRTLVFNFDLTLLDKDGKTGAAATFSPRSLASFPKFNATQDTNDINDVAVSHFHNWAGSIISRLQVRLNDTVLIEDLKFYNILRCMLARLSTNKDYANSIYGNMEGYHPTLSTLEKGLIISSNHIGMQYSKDRLGHSKFSAGISFDEQPDMETILQQLLHVEAKTNKEYTIRFDLSGLMGRFPKIIYLPIVGSIDLEITFAPAETVINLDTEGYSDNKDALSYKVDNCHLQAEMYDLTQPYLNSLKQLVEMEGLNIELTNYLSYEFNLNASDQQTIRLWRRLSSLKSIFFGIKRIPISIRDQRAKVNELEEWCHAGLDNYLVFVDGRPISAHAFSTVKSAEILSVDSDTTRRSESVWELSKALNNHVNTNGRTPNLDIFTLDERMKNSILKNDIVSTGSGDPDLVAKQTSRRNLRYTADQFSVYGVDLEKSELLSGTSLSNELTIQLKFNSSSSKRLEDQGTLYDYKLYVFLYYDKRIGINSGLRITELE